MEYTKNTPYKYQYTSHVVLTKPEGEILKSIIEKHGCKNVSQLLKKVVHEDVFIISKEELEALRNASDHNSVKNQLKAQELKKTMGELMEVLSKHNYDSFDSFTNDMKALKEEIEVL